MRDAGIEPSMGSISSPWGNAAMESLMGPIKAEYVHARTFETREQASLEIFEYIEAFCNRVRIHSALGNLSPAEFEARHREGAALNAALGCKRNRGRFRFRFSSASQASSVPKRAVQSSRVPSPPLASSASRLVMLDIASSPRARSRDERTPGTGQKFRDYASR